MPGALTPWLFLLVGFVIGWVAEWLLDLFFFRPREAADLRRHVEFLQNDRRQHEAELLQARETVAKLQAELAVARPAAAPEVSEPASEVGLAAELDVPAQIEAPRAEPAALAAATASAPEAEAALPEAGITAGAVALAASRAEAEIAGPELAEPSPSADEPLGGAEVEPPAAPIGEAVQAEPAASAEQTAAVDRLEDGTAPDDFEVIPGLSAVYEGQLYEAGIRTYRALAETTAEQLALICKAPVWNTPDFGAWIVQAQALAGKE